MPDDHPVREIAAVLDLSWVHSERAPYYPQLGRVDDPDDHRWRRVAIRSERALCRRFCELSIEGKIPGSFGVLACAQRALRDSGIFRSEIVI